MNKKSDPWITPEIPRIKNPACDLKRTYKHVFRISMVIAFILHVGIGLMFPTFTSGTRKIERRTIIIETVDIPETRQIHRAPPPPRPSIPIATESEDVPDDVTIETTDLDFDKVDLHVPPPPGETTVIEEPEEEILEYFMVEEKPVLIHRVAPVYPPVALKAGIEGTVHLKILVDKAGVVEQAAAVKGKEIFYKAALQSVNQYRFKPARQNDRPVKVYLVIPIRFRITR
ncbi:MAG: energy transducer TonB [Gemmatimonadetes bacterium]|nr:energy transducer TonB [Gemmatimonadota bacterium]